MAEFVVQLDERTVRFESNLHHLDALKSVTEKIDRGELSDRQAVAICEKYRSRKGLSHQEWSWLHYFAISPEFMKQSAPKPAVQPKRPLESRKPKKNGKQLPREPKSKSSEIKLGNAIKPVKVSNFKTKSKSRKSDDLAAYDQLQKLASAGKLSSPREYAVASNLFSELTAIERKEMHAIIYKHKKISDSETPIPKGPKVSRTGRNKSKKQTSSKSTDKEATREIHTKLQNLVATGEINAPHAHRLAEVQFDALKSGQRKTVNGLVVQYEKDLEYKKSIKPTGKKNEKKYADIGDNLEEGTDDPGIILSRKRAWERKERRKNRRK